MPQYKIDNLISRHEATCMCWWETSDNSFSQTIKNKHVIMYIHIFYLTIEIYVHLYHCYKVLIIKCMNIVIYIESFLLKGCAQTKNHRIFWASKYVSKNLRRSAHSSLALSASPNLFKEQHCHKQIELLVKDFIYLIICVFNILINSF